MEITEQARGRWREILPLLGVSSDFLKNRHGPCPICGGKDRFRFDDKQIGLYFCNQCGAGNGFTLLRKMHRWDYAEAVEQVGKIVGDRPLVRMNGHPADDSSRRKVAIENLLASANDSRVVERYLRSRGLKYTTGVLQGHPACSYYDGGTYVGRFPAVVAPILGPDGSLQSAHRIYDGQVSERKKMMPAVGTVKGAAVRLFPPRFGALALAEGIETALAVHEMDKVPVWAALTAGGIEAFECPQMIRAVRIYADNDESMTGQAAAYALARRLAKRSVAVQVLVPPVVNSDWLDVLNEKRRQPEASAAISR